MHEVPDILLFMRQVKPRYPQLLASIAETCRHPYNLIVEYDENSTAFEACERAIRRSNSRWTCICDDDVRFVEQNWLLKLIEVIESDDNLGSCTPHEWKHEEEIAEFFKTGREKFFDGAPYGFTTYWMSGFTTLFDREKMPHLYCDTNIPGRYGMSDVDLCLQVRDAGYEVAATCETTVAHLYHPMDEQYRKQYGIRAENEQDMHGQQVAYMQQKWGEFYERSKKPEILRTVRRPSFARKA